MIVEVVDDDSEKDNYLLMINGGTMTTEIHDKE